jgi:DUF971 family protein
MRELRDGCPCATCREKRSHPAPPTLLPVLSAAETQPLAIRAMKPVGNYAYAISFSDGHDTGIYTIEYLRELGSEKNDDRPATAGKLHQNDESMTKTE